MRNLFLLFSFCLFLVQTLNAQSGSSPWTVIDEAKIANFSSLSTRSVSPTEYVTLQLDVNVLQGIFATVPKEEESSNKVSDAFEVLMPDGKIEAFYLTEYSMMEPALAAKYPEMKTYHGYGVEDASRRIRLDWTSSGLNAMLMLPEGLAFVKPYARGDKEHYLSYFERAVPQPTEPFECGTIDEGQMEEPQGNNAVERAGDCQLRRFRLAIAATGEYTTLTLGASSAGTAADDALVTSHMVSNVNQMNGWYERDITVRFILIGNLTDVFYYDGANDPYTNSSASTMLAENISNMSATLGNATFDIGHVLGNSGGSGGIAGLGVLCGSSKARGVTRASAFGITQPRFLKVLSHELGHQFGAGHTQNENCARSSTSAMEPGAGTTIMSYVTSACANQVQSVPDYYFHAISIQQMSATANGTSCATILSSANSAPTVSAGPNKTVPSSTPLLLEAIASDPDGDPLTYTWEQFDNDQATAIPPQPTNTLGPQFRSFPPSAESGRYLPNLNAVLNGTTPTWEVLPSVARQMEFRVTVRDNSTNSISCTAEDNIVITTVAGGPFEVTTANTTGTVWREGETRTVNWNVAGTNTAPVSCANVDILLSYDGGQTFPTTLETGVTNNGSANVTVPTGLTTTARLLVRCSDNIFYNVSVSTFEIQVALTPTFTLDLPVISSSDCPGVPVTIPINTTSVAGFSGSITLSTSNVPSTAGATFTNPTITAGASTSLSISNTANLAAGDYPITVTATSGSIVRNVTYTLTVLEPAGLTILDQPSVGETDVSLLPRLAWVLKPNATSYDVQLSQDPNFTSLIVNQTVIPNSYSLTSSLQGLSVYYWRVKASTTCGDTPWSPTREFSTANCTQAAIQNTPVAISGSGTPTVTSVITITQPGTVDAIKVSNISGVHTWADDLNVDLIGPGGGPVVRLWEDLCGNSDDFNISFSDDATVAVSAAPCGPLGQGGTYIPQGSLSAFFGLPIAGDWTLRIFDDANQDGGQLNTWTLEFCSSSSVPLPVEMISFDATADKNKILLDWKTSSEINNAGFDIERRAEHETAFKLLSSVEARDDEQLVNEYAYVDANVKPGVRYYYRLRQNDLDGNYEYSEIRTAVLAGEIRGLQVYPNPVRGELSGFLAVEATTQTELVLLDLNGRVVLAKAVTGPAFTLHLNQIPKGIYVLKAKHVGGEEIVKIAVD